MDFDSLVSRMDDTVTTTFQRVVGGSPQPVTLHPNDGSRDVTVPCVVQNPVMEEDYVPGAQQGTGMLILFIPPSAGVVALRGFTATYGGVDYDVLQSDADRCGGVHIRLRARTQPWDQ